MFEQFDFHNRFKQGIEVFLCEDPQLRALSRLRYQYSASWWHHLSLDTPGIYILTGGRQIGKSTSCKLLIAHCLTQKTFASSNILYLPCDEIYDATTLRQYLTEFLDNTQNQPFLLIIDEITFVKNWDRVIKSLADQGRFYSGVCLLTGSDSLILKEAAMSFPGRRGNGNQTDFHILPLTFADYVNLVMPELVFDKKIQPPANHIEQLSILFHQYLQCGGYLRAINDLAEHGHVLLATLQTYEQWIRGDFLKQGKKETYLLDVLQALLSLGVSQISYSGLTQKIASMSKETCLDYCDLLKRMDIIFDLQAYDQNTKLGFPKKARKIHFCDPFIRRAIQQWLIREGYTNSIQDKSQYESILVESIVANYCARQGKAFYFKGQGEVDVIYRLNNKTIAVEVKWAHQVRPADLKTLQQMVKQCQDVMLLSKTGNTGNSEGIHFLPVYQFLMS